jgi:energy-coupling factor transporter ATP-binding protein EcfA2
LSPFLGKDSHGNYYLHIPTVASYQVTPGGEVHISPSDNIPMSELSVFLLGPVLSMLCHQRGLLPIHAAAIRWRDGAILLAGRSGSGKSTFAAALARRGYEVLSDDLSIVAETGHGCSVMPMSNELRLWKDALQALDIPSEGLTRNREGQDKYRYAPTAPMSGGGSILVKRIYFLRTRVNRSEMCWPIGPNAAAVQFLEQIDQIKMAEDFGVKEYLIATANRISRQVPVFGFQSRLSFASLQADLDLLETALADELALGEVEHTSRGYDA